ncbi:MAG: hypothetical protein ACOC00_07165 [Halothiobacillaceae bacterium]
MSHHYPMQGAYPVAQAGAVYGSGMYPSQMDQEMQRYQYQLLMNAAVTGAMIGASGAAAMQLHRRQQQGISWGEVGRGTVKGAFQVGVAVTAATAVGRLFNNPTWGTVAGLATGTAVMYALTGPKDQVTAKGETEHE